MHTWWASVAAILSFASFSSALPADAVAGKVKGCGKTLHLRGVEVNRKVANGRNYWYRLPIDYDKNNQYPVVMGFHGSSKLGGTFDGLAFAADSKLSLIKYSKDVSCAKFYAASSSHCSQKIMVYPNGKGVCVTVSA